MPSKEPTPTVDSAFQLTRGLWFAFLVTQGLIAGVTVMQKGAAASTADPVVTWAMLAVAMMIAPVSWVVKNALLAKAAAKQEIQGVQAAHVVAFAMSEAASILGMVVHFAFGSRYYFLFFVVGIAAHISHFPRRTQFEAASGPKPIV